MTFEKENIQIEGKTLRIGLGNNYRYNLENMKEYEITDKFDVELFVNIEN